LGKNSAEPEFSRKGRKSSDFEPQGGKVPALLIPWRNRQGRKGLKEMRPHFRKKGENTSPVRRGGKKALAAWRHC